MSAKINIFWVFWAVVVVLPPCKAESHFERFSEPEEVGEVKRDSYMGHVIKEGGLTDIFRSPSKGECCLRWITMSSWGGRAGSITVNRKSGIVRLETSIIVLVGRGNDTLISIRDRKIARVTSEIMAKDLEGRIMSGAGVPSEENVMHREIVADGSSTLIGRISNGREEYVYIPSGIVWKDEDSEDLTFRKLPEKEIARLENAIADQKK